MPVYSDHPTRNVFKSLDDDISLYVLSFALVSNDLMTNGDALDRYSESDGNYYFCTSVSIVRELALLVSSADRANLMNEFSTNTKEIFDSLKEKLVPFDNESLAKMVLKPVRDIVFHYNLNKAKHEESVKLSLAGLKNEDRINVGFVADDQSPAGQRYYFASSFRARAVNQLLSSEHTSDIAAIAADVITLVDYMMSDLVARLPE